MVKARPRSISKGTDWVLVVDDEFDIVSIFRQGLIRKGYRAFGFTDASLALEHFRLNYQKYCLVISDCRIPGMNGYDFVKSVKEIKPEIKVFLMTAFEINDAEFQRLLPKIKIEGFLQKPISLANLTRIVSKYMPIEIASE